MTAVNDRCHAHGSLLSGEVVVNMTVAISARDLYEKCKISYLSKELPESEIPSFSWFKFQFWPKDLTTHSALNYTGRFPVKYMLQQRMVRKSHDDDHYMNAPFNYAQEYAINIRDICCFICTDDKHKIDVGEPNIPLAVVPRGKQVLVARNEAFQVGDHDFSTISLIPTVILINDIPESIEKSWYRGKACVGIKMTATNPSSALRKATEIAKVLINMVAKKLYPPFSFCTRMVDPNTTQHF